MRLLFYIDTIGYGGAERVIVNLANQLHLRGHECTVVTSFEKTPEYEVDKGVLRLSLNREYINNFYKRNFLLTVRLRKVLKEKRPQLAIVFLPEPIFRMSIASVGINVKLIYSIRNAPEKEYGSSIYKKLGKLLLPKADGFVFQTKEAQDYFLESIQKRSEVIFNQVDERFYKLYPSIKKSGIVTTARLAPQKNHKLLIDAFSLIKDHTTQNLYIYGEGYMKDELCDYVKSKGLENRVFIPGPVEDVANMLNHSLLYVLSSDYEGMPNGLMEAMAIGLPCVSTDCPCGGPKALFGPLQSQYLVPVNDINALSNAILTVLSSKEQSKQLSVENKENAKKFSPSEIILKWDSFILKTYNT